MCSSDLANVELICDGVHIHPAMIVAVHKMFGDRLIIVSDSLRLLSNLSRDEFSFTLELAITIKIDVTEKLSRNLTSATDLSLIHISPTRGRQTRAESALCSIRLIQLTIF